MTPPRSSTLSSSRAGAAAALAALLLVTAACGDGAPVAPPAGREAGTAARAALTTGTNCTGPGAHEKHINMFPCTACHPTGATFGFAIPYTFPGGTTTAGGTIVVGTATTPTTCAVACHHPNGAPPREIAWDTPGPLPCTSCHVTSALPQGHPPVAADAPRSECERCHSTGSHTEGTVSVVAHASPWMDETSSGFHAYAANRGFAECKACHGEDLAGGVAPTGCGKCHDQKTPTFVSWKDRCTMCHGGTENASGAPPDATWGNSADAIRVGAHSSHLGSAIAPAIGCEVCHVKPSDALATAHVDGGTAEVTFGGAAVIASAPTWDRASGRCAATYCHAGSGGTTPIPTWTKVGMGEAACGACHGLAPPAPHPAVGPELTRCGSCHDLTVDATGAVIPPAAGGKHLDGMVQASGHPDAWMDRTSDGFHAYSASRGLTACTPCHGVALDGAGAPVANVDCASCHGAGWSARCTMCHGGTADQTGAPPRTTWGNAADAVRAGAHATHVQGTAISPAFDCTICHLKTMSAFTVGHIDPGPSEVVFGGHAVAGHTPVWDRAAATCANTHCHAGPGGTLQTPTWTRVGQGEAACGTCHGLPPPAPAHPPVSADPKGCGACHSATMDAAGAVIAPASGGKHLDGIVEASGHAASWMDESSEGHHAYSANRGLDDCKSCHGANLDGVGGVARGCQACHGESWKTSCTMCHGGTIDQSGAPPRTVWGKGSDPLRVGAHTVHLASSATHRPVACENCHQVPASATTPGHVDTRDSANVTLTGIATKGMTAGWNRTSGTCATYCHGATLPEGSNAAPTWTGGPPQAACGTCHGSPPSTGAHWHYDYGAATCGDCHGYGYYSGGDATLHVNGTKDVGGNVIEWTPAAGGSGTCTSACHDTAVW